jgi:hypothetical protein
VFVGEERVENRARRSESNSAPKLNVSLEAVRRPSLDQSHEAPFRARHILAFLLLSNITPPWRGAAKGQALPRAKLPTSLYHTELAHEFPAGRLDDLAAVKVASSYGSVDRAQHPFLMAPNRRLKKLTSRNSLQAEEQTLSIFQYISANCAAMDSTSSFQNQRILHPYVFTDFKFQQALSYTKDAITSRSHTWSLRRKGQRQSTSQRRRSFRLR